jgi:hypothetical protein
MDKPGLLMLIARLALGLIAAMYLLIGVGVMLAPATMEGFGIALLTPTGISTVRTWGALFAGLGTVGLACSARQEWLAGGFAVFLAVSGLVLMGRGYGIWADGVEPAQWTELRREAIGFAMAVAGRIALAISRRSC